MTRHDAIAMTDAERTSAGEQLSPFIFLSPFAATAAGPDIFFEVP